MYEICLPTTTHAQLIKGNLVTQKTTNKLSALDHDQVHEQHATVKRDVSMSNRHEAALRRWMVAGPETARLLTECEEKHSRKKKESERHHEQISSVQNTFLAQTKNVTDVIEEHDNPFEKTQATHSITHLLWSD